MPVLSPETGYLTVVNVFEMDSVENQDKVLDAMREIVDAAAYPGWISSAVHSGVDRPGTLNIIQWRSGEDLEKRYEGEEFRHRTMPLFQELTTSIRLFQTHVAHSQVVAGGGAEYSPSRDDHTVVELIGVPSDLRAELVSVLARDHDWLAAAPGFRSQTVLSGDQAQGVTGSFVIIYAQWADQASHQAFLAVPERERPTARQEVEARVAELAQWRDGNSYRVLHTRSADR